MARDLNTKQELGKQEATVRDFLNVIFRRKIMIIAIVLVTTTLVYTLNSIQPQVYESNSRVLIRRGETQSVFEGIRYLSWEEEISSQIEVILSEAVFSKARQIFSDTAAACDMPDYMKFNPGFVRADAIGESNVLAIRYTGFDPLECKLGCASVTQAYAEYYKQKKTPPELSDFFAREIKDIQTQLAHWRQKKNDFLNREKFFGMDEEGRFLLGKMSNLEMRASTINSEVSAQQSKVDNLQVLSKLSPEELENELTMSVPPSVLQSGIIINIKNSLRALRTEEEELKNKYTERHPKMVANYEQIRDLQESLKQEVENTFKIEKSNLQDILEQQRANQSAIIKTQMAINKIPDKETELNKIDHEIELLETKYSDLIGKQDESLITMASSPDWEVILLSPASNAYAKKTKDYVRLAVGPFLSLIVAMGLAFFLESLDHSLSNVAEVEEYLNANVLATISEMHSDK
ncbi:MAG: Wzz/FepE/Etk N-terminal domain-containing protein [Candidatus Latescibacterota bacterium]